MTDPPTESPATCRCGRCTATAGESVWCRREGDVEHNYVIIESKQLPTTLARVRVRDTIYGGLVVNVR